MVYAPRGVTLSCGREFRASCVERLVLNSSKQIFCYSPARSQVLAGHLAMRNRSRQVHNPPRSTIALYTRYYTLDLYRLRLQ